MRIFSLIDANLVINVLPKEVVVEEIRYWVDENDNLVLTDGKAFKMNINEFGLHR